MTNHQISFVCDFTEYLYQIINLFSTSYVTKDSHKWVRIILIIAPILLKYLQKICDSNSKNPTDI